MRLCQFLGITVLLSLLWPIAPVAAHPAAQSAPAQVQCALGTAYYALGQVVDALQLLEAGAAQIQASSTANDDSAATCLLWLGVLRQSIGDLNGALEAYTPALAIFRRTGNRQQEWTMLYGTAAIMLAQGRYQEGQSILEQQALPLTRQNDTWIPASIKTLAEAVTLNNIGVAQARQGVFAQAQKNVESAHQLILQLLAQRTSGQPSAVPGVLGVIGADNAEIEPRQLLKLLRLLEPFLLGESKQLDPQTLGELLGALIEMAPASADSPTSDLPDPDVGGLPAPEDLLQQLQSGQMTPEQLLEKLYPQNAEGQNPQQDASAALLMRLLGLNSDSAALDQSSLLEVILGNNSLEPLIEGVAQGVEPVMLNNLGEIAREQGRQDAALQQYQLALDRIDEALQSDHPLPSNVYYEAIAAMVYNNRGLAYAQHKAPKLALMNYEQALERMHTLKQRVGEVTVLTNRGDLLRTSDPASALKDFKDAIDILEDIRLVGDSRLTTAEVGSNANAITTYALGGALVQQVDLYNYAVQLSYQQAQKLPENKRDELYRQAFDLSERGRARLFLDLVNTTRFDTGDGTLTPLIYAERRAALELQAATDTLNQMEALDPPSSLLLDAQQQQVNAERQYRRAAEDLRMRGPRFAQLLTEQGGVLNSHAVQAQLDSQTTLIAYYTYDQRILRDEPALAFVLTHDHFDVVPLPLANADFRENIAAELQTWQTSQQRKLEHPAALQTLYGALIKPLQQRKLLNTEQIGIVPHNQLHLIPFAALSDGKRYLIDDHALFMLPSASALKLVQDIVDAHSQPSAPKALIFGNPELDRSLGLAVLPLAGVEAINVAKLLQTPVYTGTAATETRLRAEANQVNIIHLAAHGIFAPQQPLDSAVYLAGTNAGESQTDGMLQAREIFTMRFSLNDLLVLSACQSNLGSISAADELIGLTRAFFTAGTPSIVSTLWYTEDTVSNTLITEFYQAWLTQGLSKADALRMAQKEIRATRSPYFWAPFTLSGDPRHGKVSLHVPTSPPAPATATVTSAPAMITPNHSVPTVTTSTNTPLPPVAIAPTADVEPPAAPPTVAQPATSKPPSGGSCGTPIGIIGLGLAVFVYRRRRRNS